MQETRAVADAAHSDLSPSWAVTVCAMLLGGWYLVNDVFRKFFDPT